jgi:RNA polymerase sigma factor (sigma-70 family)
VVRQVLRDPAQSEEIAQEVLLEIWRTATRFDPAKGSPAAWALTIAHRRAVDRVRSENASSRREERAAAGLPGECDDVAEVVAATLDRQRVRRCLDSLTELQRESIKLAYYGGYSAPDARTETERTSVGGTVTVVVSAGQQAAVVSATGMRSLPSAQTYQLWVIGPDGARSAGLLSGAGRAGPVLASGVELGDRIGITVEPAGGTSSPTTTPVIAVPV